MFDFVSYVMGHKKGKNDGKSDVVIESDNLTFTDDGEGNITITED